jgi:hypothetical protein
MGSMTCANLNLMRLDSVRNGVSDAHANICRRPCGHGRGKFCARSQSSIRSIWRLRWKIVFDCSGLPIASLPATFGFPVASLAPLFVLASTSIRFWAPLTGSLGPYYDGGGYTDPYYQSSYAYPDGPYPGGAVAEIPSSFSPPVVRHRGCESESVTVPSEHRGKQSVNVNIVRCY